jgi:hypothetical protein
MRILYLLIFIIIIIEIFYYLNKKEYLTIFALNGLNNKLQVILSYLYKANQENKKLRIIWIKNKECPDRFDNLFLDIENVEFVYTLKVNESSFLLNSTDISELSIEKLRKIWQTQGFNLQIDDIVYTPHNTYYLYQNYYKLLIPKKEIQLQIDETIKLLNYNYIACHIRRTDAVLVKKYKDGMKTDKEYMKFIKKFKNLKIYIATDCKHTQEKFIKKYPNRIIYKEIQQTNQLRQTSLQDAVKDMYICANATYFMGSVSTFTDSIIELRKIKLTQPSI